MESGDIKDVDIKDMGQHRLKGLQTDTQLYQILPNCLTGRKFPEYGVTEQVEDKPDITSLEAEMEQLSKENEQLKEKMSSLEAEAQEAIERAATLSKWLEEIQKDLPPSLGKELLSATKNIGILMKSHSNISNAIAIARKDSQRTMESYQKTKRKLRKSERKIHVLQTNLLNSEAKCAELEEKVQAFEIKWQSLPANRVKKFLTLKTKENKSSKYFRSESVPSSHGQRRKDSISDPNLKETLLKGQQAQKATERTSSARKLQRISKTEEKLNK